MLLFAIPSGIICAASALTTYAIALSVDEPLGDAQSAATVTLFIVATSVLLQSARPLNAIRIAIVGSMVAAFVGVLVIPWLSTFFALSVGPERHMFVAVAIGLVGGVLVWVAALVTDRWRRPGKGLR